VRIVERCLEKHPRARFQTALDVCNELKRVKRTLDSGARPAAPSADVASIAVLPFVNRSRDEEDEYFAEGLADEMLNLLAKIRGLRVAARSSSATFKGKTATVAEVGRALNVAAVLEGSVRKAGHRVRISVQLVKVADGYQIWSDTYDRTLEDIFAVQDDIAQSVVKELRATLLGESADSGTSGEVRAEVAAAAKGRGADPEAHREFIHGRYLIGRFTPDDVARGIEHLQQALAIDPEHALAWAWLSWGETQSASFGFSGAASLERARHAAQRALAIEPDLAEAHLALGSIRLLHDFDWKGADASIGRALQLAPGNAEVLRVGAVIEYCLGRVDRSLELSMRAVEQDPLNAANYLALGRAYRRLERLVEADAAFRRALEISPDCTTGHFLLAMSLAAQGRLDEALAEVQRERADWARWCGVAIIQHSRGCPRESDEAMEKLLTRADSSAWQIASVHAHRGNADEAFAWLERSFVQRDAGLPLTGGAAHFRSLHSDPRWPAFMRRIGLETSA
jgi:TolB-like protein/Tfp pilus assembly protein PilF